MGHQEPPGDWVNCPRGWSIRVTRPLWDRAHSIHKTLREAVKQRGGRVIRRRHEDEDEPRKTLVIFRGVEIPIRLREKWKMIPFEPTKEEREVGGWWRRQRKTRWVTSGVLSVDQGGSGGPTWTDCDRYMLEDRIEQIADYFKKQADHEIAEQEREEEEYRQWQEMERRRVECRRHKAAEALIPFHIQAYRPMFPDLYAEAFEEALLEVKSTGEPPKRIEGDLAAISQDLRALSDELAQVCKRQELARVWA